MQLTGVEQLIRSIGEIIIISFEVLFLSCPCCLLSLVDGREEDGMA